jgi:alkaline phosphatase
MKMYFFCHFPAGNIDACAQAHDAACLAYEVLAMQESFEAVADLVTKAKDTACLIASDRDSGPTPTIYLLIKLLIINN